MTSTTLLLPLALGLYATVAVLERVPRFRFKASPLFRPFFGTDVLWYLSTLAVVLVGRPYLLRLPTSPLAEGLHALSLPVAIALAALVYDLTAFLIHVAVHRADVLWEIHKVHHSSRTLDWLATTRQHAAEGLIRNLPSQAVLVLLGFPVEAIVGAVLIYVGFAAMGHGNLRIDLRWIEPLFITPRLHRLHHIPETTQSNFGTIFSFWDRISGSLISRDASRDEPLGVPGEVETYPQRFIPAFLQPVRTLLRLDRRPSPVPAAVTSLEES